MSRVDEAACVDADTLAAYLEGTLGDHDRRSVETHVDQCAACRADVVALTRAGAVPAVTPSEETSGVAGPLVAGAAVGRYVIRGWLGAGGMGVVYRAFDPYLKRDVALKIVRPPDHGGDPEATRARVGRLVTEAAHMARVTHPNVVAVYDAGEDGGRSYVAQELVDGTTLGAWQAAPERKLADVLDRYLEAARGLAAAHAAGIVHRDFKPSNVLVGNDGRARVGDFGLALVTSAEERESSARARSARVAGTPRFMAPEQKHGEATAKSDQYAFAVALEGALQGLVERGNARVPARVKRALARARSDNPGERFDDMDALVRALRPETPRRGLWVVAAVLVLAAVGGGVATQRRERPCEGAGVGVESVRASVTKIASLSGAGLDPKSAETLEHRLRDWTDEWSRARIDACTDTRVRGVQSEAALDLRIRCLSDQAHQVETLVNAVVGSDAGTVGPGVLRRELPTPRACEDLRTLEVRLRPPDDPAARVAVEDARKRLAESRAAYYLGRWDESRALASQALAEASRLEYRPLEAEAQIALGDVAGQLGQFEQSLTHLRAGHRAAVACHHDQAAAYALVFVVWHLAVSLARFDEARSVGLEAAAALEARGEDDDLRAWLEVGLSAAEAQTNHHAEALAHHDRALGHLARSRARGRPIVWREIETKRVRGVALLELGRVDEGAAAIEAAIAEMEEIAKVVPARKTNLSAALDDLARARAAQGRPKEALDLELRAVTLARELVGDRSRDVALCQLGTGQYYEVLGRMDDAVRAYGLASERLEELFGSNHVVAARARVLLENARLAQGATDLAAARASLERASKVLRGPGAPELDRARADVAFARLVIAERPGSRGCHQAAEHMNSALEHFTLAAREQTLLPGERPDIARAFWSTSRCATIALSR